VDTVEWGTSERRARWVPRLRYSVPRLGAPALALAGFVLLAVAEFVPWARVDLGGGSTLRSDASIASELAVTLDRVVSNDAFAFQLGMVALLGAVGYTLTTSAMRRRVAVGTTVGVAAGNLLLIILVARAALHSFDTLSGFGLAPRPETTPTLSVGPGVYLAVAGVLVLAAAAVTAAGLRRVRRTEQPAPVPAAADEEPVFTRGGERELTVTPMEPLDESYFARPDNH
jgi:hypothetical protein